MNNEIEKSIKAYDEFKSIIVKSMFQFIGKYSQPGENNLYPGCGRIMIDVLKHCLQEAKDQMKVRDWISVDEFLPRINEKVLFHWIGQDYNKNISMGYLCNEGWDIYLPYHSFKLSPNHIKVTHWAELPCFPDVSHESISKFMEESRMLFKMELERDVIK